MTCLRKVTLAVFLCIMTVLRAGAQVDDEEVGYRSVAELENSILSDSRWMEEADRLMADLEAMDVQLFVQLNRVEGAEIRNRLIRERNNIRRLMIELTAARNSVFIRLEENRILYSRMELGPPAGFPTH